MAMKITNFKFQQIMCSKDQRNTLKEEPWFSHQLQQERMVGHIRRQSEDVQ
jgi:hypothetical protein